jgi:hypothetical protein
MARNMPGRQVARPVQGHNTLSQPRKLPKWSPSPEPAPRQVTRGSLSRPTPLPKWNPGTLPQDRPGRVVQR